MHTNAIFCKSDIRFWRRIFFGTWLSLVTLISGTLATGHEGHAPLPTKGVQVDTAKGLLTLSPNAQTSLGVQTMPAAMEDLGTSALAYATLVTPWQQQYFVGPPISGRIAQLHVVTGQEVAKGDLLAELSSPEFETILLELKNAIRERELSERQVVRLRTLIESQAVPARDLLEGETRHRQNENAVEIAKSKLKSLGFDKQALSEIESADGDTELLLPIFSPIAGSVSHTDLSVGKVVAPTEHLFEITDLSRLWVQIGVLERDLSRIKPGQPVALELSAFPGQTITTTVSIPSVIVDPETHLGTVWAEIKNPPHKPKYLPGMYGLARISTSSSDKVLSVPTSAVLGSGAERYVLVEVAKTAKGVEYQRKNVVIGARNGSRSEIRGGELYPGDQVVSRGGQVLSSFFVLGSLRLSPEGIRNVGLKVEPAETRVIQDIIEFDGLVDLRPGHSASVSSQLAGVLHRVLVERGQEVAAGDVVAEVTGTRLQDTQLEMIRSHLEAKQLETTLGKLEALRNTLAIAAKRLWEIENQRDLAVNRRDSARRTLGAMGMSDKQLELILADREPVPAIPVRTPISGVVVGLDKTPGETIREEDSILQIHDLSRPWVQGFVSELQAGRVSVGSKVRVRLVADPNFLGEGEVVRSAQTLSGSNRSLPVWIELKEQPGQRLQRNLLARISAIVGERRSMLTIPRSAVLHDGARSYVFVQKRGGLIERRSAELGPADDRFVGILKGLTQGEPVAVQGVSELQTTYASVR